jgi:hypothetical protein
MTALVCDQPPAEPVRYVHQTLEVRGSTDVPAQITVRFAGASVVTEPAIDPDDPSRHRFSVDVPVPEGVRGVQAVAISSRTAAGAEMELERTVIAEPYEHPVGPTAEALAGGGVAMATGPPDLTGALPAGVPVRLAGWCFALSGVDRVRAILDGEREYDLVYPLLRRDIRRVLEHPDALLSGFELILDGAECPPGRHSIAVLATTTDGRTVGQAGEFECVPASDGPAPDLAEPSTGEVEEEDSVLAETTAAGIRLWHRWAAAQATARRVLVIAGVDRGELVSALRGTASEVVVVDQETSLESLPHPDGWFALVVTTALDLGEAALNEFSRVLGAEGVLLARGDDALAERIRARWPDAKRWAPRAELVTAIAPAPSGSESPVTLITAPGPVTNPPGVETATLDLASLDEEDRLRRLRMIIAERHAIVSTQEGDVMARYHQELLRAHARLRDEFVLCERELERERSRTREVERAIEALRASASWRFTRPLRALKHSKMAQRAAPGRSRAT